MLLRTQVSNIELKLAKKFLIFRLIINSILIYTTAHFAFRLVQNWQNWPEPLPTKEIINLFLQLDLITARYGWFIVVLISAKLSIYMRRAFFLFIAARFLLQKLLEKDESVFVHHKKHSSASKWNVRSKKYISSETNPDVVLYRSNNC